MKSSQDVDSAWAGVLADNEFTCIIFNEFLSLSLFCSYLSPVEQRFPMPAPTAWAIAVLGNLLFTPELVWGFR